MLSFTCITGFLSYQFFQIPDLSPNYQKDKKKYVLRTLSVTKYKPVNLQAYQ